MPANLLNKIFYFYIKCGTKSITALINKTKSKNHLATIIKLPPVPY